MENFLKKAKIIFRYAEIICELSFQKCIGFWKLLYVLIVAKLLAYVNLFIISFYAIECHL